MILFNNFLMLLMSLMLQVILENNIQYKKNLLVFNLKNVIFIYFLKPGKLRLNAFVYVVMKPNSKIPALLFVFVFSDRLKKSLFVCIYYLFLIHRVNYNPYKSGKFIICLHLLFVINSSGPCKFRNIIKHNTLEIHYI